MHTVACGCVLNDVTLEADSVFPPACEVTCQMETWVTVHETGYHCIRGALLERPSSLDDSASTASLKHS